MACLCSRLSVTSMVVVTVVALLFSLIRPNAAFFGEKDFQQLRIVEQMVEDLKLPVRVIRGALVREESGLAMSSRNARLSQDNRAAAAAISRGLLKAQELCESGVKESAELVKAALAEISTISDHTLDYLAVVDESTLEPLTTAHANSRILTVVRVQGVRLLDNIALTLGQ